jgi:glutathione peroxidase-family protein
MNSGVPSVVEACAAVAAIGLSVVVAAASPCTASSSIGRLDTLDGHFRENERGTYLGVCQQFCRQILSSDFVSRFCPQNFSSTFIEPSAKATRARVLGTNQRSRAICDFLRREDELMTELMNHKRSTSY